MKPIAVWIEQANAALRRAGQRAWERAARTRTPVLVRQDGRVVKLYPGTGDGKPGVAPGLALREEPPEYGKKSE